MHDMRKAYRPLRQVITHIHKASQYTAPVLQTYEEKQEMKVMTSDEIMSKLHEYERIYYKFENSVTPITFDMLKAKYGRDYRLLGPMFKMALDIVKDRKSEMDCSESVRRDITLHIEKYKPLFELMENLADRPI